MCILVFKCEEYEEILDGEFKREGSEYRAYRKVLIRNSNPQDIVKFIAKYINKEEKYFYVKYKKKYTHMRALGCFFMSCFCNLSQKNICKVIGNITQSRVSKLSEIGLNLAFNYKYRGIVDDFLLNNY